MSKGSDSNGKKKPSIITKLLIFVVVAAVISIASITVFLKLSSTSKVIEELKYNIPESTYNINGGFIKLSVNIAYTEKDVLKAIEKDIVMLKQTMIEILRDTSPSELQTGAQIEAFRKKLTDAFNKKLLEYNGNLKEDKKITNVYFDTCVIN